MLGTLQDGSKTERIVPLVRNRGVQANQAYGGADARWDRKRLMTGKDDQGATELRRVQDWRDVLEGWC